MLPELFLSTCIRGVNLPALDERHRTPQHILSERADPPGCQIANVSLDFGVDEAAAWASEDSRALLGARFPGTSYEFYALN